MEILSANNEAFKRLDEAMQTAGEEYKRLLERLINLINEITNGDIQGDPAKDLLNKFQSKESDFRGLAQTINEAEQYIAEQKARFGAMMGNIEAGMR